MPLKCSFKRELERKIVISWKPPANTSFCSIFAFLWRLYYLQAGPSQWLNNVGLLEAKLPAQHRTPQMGIYVLGFPIHLIKTFSKQHCSLKLFLPNFPSSFLRFHGGHTCIAVWSFSPSSPVLISLYHSAASLSQNLYVQYLIVVCFIEDSSHYTVFI